jgi:ribosomal protein S18 acetylase RimI-like enzyme
MNRRANSADLDRLTHLFDLYRQFYLQPANLSGAREFLKERLEKEESVIFVSYQETHPEILRGFTQLYPGFSSIGMRKTWVLNDLFVASEFRKSGVAEELIGAAVNFSKASGARALYLQTAKTNVAAQRLYEKLGWVREEKYLTYSFHH